MVSRRMRSAGLPPSVQLSPSRPEDHDDLPTHFELGSAEVECMRRDGLLFDRTSGGDYLQVYTESFAKRFFFEIVWR